MKKIPTLFIRDENDRRYVTEAVTPGCEWVLAGEGVATRKFDGTCVMLDGGAWWARREVKPGKIPPTDFVTAEYDSTTGKTVGWEPIGQSAFARWHAEALQEADANVEDLSAEWAPGTYELIGPKANGNPEHYDGHWLIRHSDASHLVVPELTFEGIRKTVLALAGADGCEGVVWHHEDGRMVKIKARDFAR